MKLRATANTLEWMPFLVVALCAVALGMLCISWSFPCPMVDDAFYKSPAAELAQHGRLAIPCSAGFLPRMNDVFACYPPLYQLVLAVWYAIFGVSLQSSIAFSFCVHSLVSLLIVEVCRRIVHDECGTVAPRSWWLPLTTGIVHLCNLAYFDRQEELAVLFVFLQVLLAWQTAPGSVFVRNLGIGLCAGCATLTSPWVGLLAVAHIFIREWLCVSAIRSSLGSRCFSLVMRLGVVASVISLMIAGWFFTIELFYPGVIRDQFVGILRHLGATQKTTEMSQRIAVFYETLCYSRGQLLVTAIVAGGMLAAFSGRSTKPISRNVVALFFVAILGTGLLIWKRPEAYTYFGGMQILSLPCLASVFPRFFMQEVRERNDMPRVSFVGKAALAGCLILAARDTATHAYYAIHIPSEEQAKQVFARLQTRIPEKARVAATARHWLAFQGRNEWRESFFSSLESPAEVLACDWLVMEPDRGQPYFLDHFELVEAVASSTPACHTYAYSLYKRRLAPIRSPENKASGNGPGLTLTRGSAGR